MNYLAHLFLSCGDEDLLIGNFIADSIKNKEVKNYSEAIQKGILLHRQIDSYTDAHHSVKQSTRRLYPMHGKYAPVVVDILYDHLLARNWQRYSGESLDSFAVGIYEILNRRMDDLPTKLQLRLPGMIKGNWLTSYRSVDGLMISLRKMDERTAFPSNFVNAPKDLYDQYELFESDFNQFFPELINYADLHCKC